ncbi:MAG: peptidylprolyl isomerase [Alphaproteobacteria bacterium]|nr:peptidylprolyl isomerase [Alphaproteobacteria bacterium]
MRTGWIFAGLLAVMLPAFAAPQAQIVTSMGTITVALAADKAPKTVANFVRYAREGHFDGTVVYRVVPGFVIQMGGYDGHGNYRTPHAPIPLETGNGLSNQRGTLAMARDTPDSATSEFFINLADNSYGLDPKPGDAPGTTGYAVFGQVTAGMDVVDAIAAVPVGGGQGPFPDAEPKTAVKILKVTITDTATP